MGAVLDAAYLSVLAVESREAFWAELVRFSDRLGFETVSAMTVIDHPVRDPEFISIDNAPAKYAELAGDLHANKRDPVMQHCKHKSVPIIWDQATYTAVGQGAKWERQAEHGYRCGIGWAMHMPAGRHFVLGVNRRQSLPLAPSEVTRMVASLQLFAVHANEAMTTIVASAVASDVPSLTPRELDALRWTLDGKTAWEIGRILSIAEDTVARHAHNATQKLGCSNKHHAAVRALRLGLIQ